MSPQAYPRPECDVPSLSKILVESFVRRALEEDLGQAGDITSYSVVSHSDLAKAKIVAREEGVMAGIQAATLAFNLADTELNVSIVKSDGTILEKGDVVAVVEGLALPILTAERTALNFLAHLSGIATATNELVNAAQGTKAKIRCTRKTTPGLRILEKYAVRIGGGVNHRFGLDEAILIKDNHIAVSGGVAQALAAAQKSSDPLTPIEVEVENIDQLDEAIAGGATSILLDNMTLSGLREAVTRADGKVIMEASGNVTVDNVREIADTGVDYISSGWITHSAPALDFGLDFLV